MRGPLWRGPLHEGVFLLGSVPRHVFAQLTYRESLRDIEAGLKAVGGKLYHMGFRSNVVRSTLADANESRDWRISADFGQILIGIARPLYMDDPLGVELNQSLYALDSTAIDLCLSVFPWAGFRKHKGRVAQVPRLWVPGRAQTTAWESSKASSLTDHSREVGFSTAFRSLWIPTG